FPGIGTAAVKYGIGTAAVNLHPEEARQMIRDGARNSLQRLPDIAPFQPESPFEMTVRYRYEHSAFKASFYPGVDRLDNVTVRFCSENLMDCFRFFYFCQG
ncbi:MAG TPA: M55 family metallopeptidase, partial [bacterium]|nr:M55 family metallopeptidase [bacterium]